MDIVPAGDHVSSPPLPEESPGKMGGNDPAPVSAPSALVPSFLLRASGRAPSFGERVAFVDLSANTDERPTTVVRSLLHSLRTRARRFPSMFIF